MRTLQDLARGTRLRRTPGAGRLSVQAEPSGRADVRPAGGGQPQPQEEAEVPSSPAPRVTILSAEATAADADTVVVLVTVSSGGPGDACGVAILVTLAADDGSQLGSAEVGLDRVPKGLTTSASVGVTVPRGTRVELRGPTFTLYSGLGTGKRLSSVSARFSRPAVPCG